MEMPANMVARIFLKHMGDEWGNRIPVLSSFQNKTF